VALLKAPILCRRAAAGRIPAASRLRTAARRLPRRPAPPGFSAARHAAAGHASARGEHRHAALRSASKSAWNLTDSAPQSAALLDGMMSTMATSVWRCLTSICVKAMSRPLECVSPNPSCTSPVAHENLSVQIRPGMPPPGFPGFPGGPPRPGFPPGGPPRPGFPPQQ